MQFLQEEYSIKSPRDKWVPESRQTLTSDELPSVETSLAGMKGDSFQTECLNKQPGPACLSASLSFPLFLIYQQADLIYQQAGAHRCNPLLLLYTGSDGSVMW